MLPDAFQGFEAPYSCGEFIAQALARSSSQLASLAHEEDMRLAVTPKHSTKAKKRSPEARPWPLETVEKRKRAKEISLKAGEIRLVRLRHDYSPESIDIIGCETRIYPSHACAQYKAISYHWGYPLFWREITVDDKTTLVAYNLYRFLQHAKSRPQQFSSWLWIDALSINQMDNEERRHQVAVMAQIFGNAEQVVAWLGPPDLGSDDAMNLLAMPRRNWTKLGPQRIKSGDAPSSPERDSRISNAEWVTFKSGRIGDEDIKARLVLRPYLSELCLYPEKTIMETIVGLCNRPYWTRLWILQELKHAKTIMLMCGSRFAPWSGLEDFWTVRGHAEEVKRAREVKPVGYLAQPVKPEPPTLSLAERMIRLRTEQIDTSLWSLLRMTKDLLCSDTRDVVYAILSVDTKGHESIEPDYTASIHSIANQILRNKYDLEPPTSLDEVAADCEFIDQSFQLPTSSILKCDQCCALRFPVPGALEESWYGWSIRHKHDEVKCIIDSSAYPTGSDRMYRGLSLRSEPKRKFWTGAPGLGQARGCYHREDEDHDYTKRQIPIEAYDTPYGGDFKMCRSLFPDLFPRPRNDAPPHE